MKPRIFIGSSSERIEIARAIRANLEQYAEIKVWDQNIFTPSTYPLESLIKTLNDMDFGLFVVTPDDIAQIRGKEVFAARDNVIFEAGLSIATLGRKRTIFVLQRDIKDFHIPTDLMGLTLVTYDWNREDKDPKSALGDACFTIQKACLERIGRRATYLTRFIEQDEFSISDSTHSIHMSKGRAYQLLLYMFFHETFDEFRAFDLAPLRWAEILESKNSQTLNVSNEIFEAMAKMFKQGRCKSFRRILVIAEAQLDEKYAEILLEFEKTEKSWRDAYGIFVETKVLIYKENHSVMKDRIRRLHDFALFSGSMESLAIIETTLTTPTSQVDNSECEITNVKERAIGLKENFDDFWDSANSISEILKHFMESSTAENRTSRPATQAFQHFQQNFMQRNSDNNSVLVVEAGYVDLRTPDDEDRHLHLEDAFWLLRKVQNKYPNLKDNLLLEAFVNDFSDINVCQYIGCAPDLDIETDERKKVISKLWSNLKQRYNAFFVEIDDCKLFGMKRTRNHVTEAIKKSLENSENHLRLRRYGDTVNEIYIDMPNQQILLGYQDTDRESRITPRCTALMAQHYFDLYKFARERKPNLRELWIFDFNRIAEKEAVKRGAEATMILYSWPKDINLHIINCIYNMDGKTGTYQTTSKSNLK